MEQTLIFSAELLQVSVTFTKGGTKFEVATYVYALLTVFDADCNVHS